VTRCWPFSQTPASWSADFCIAGGIVRAGGARLTRRLRDWKCWRRNGLGGSRRQTEYRKRKYNCGFSALTCNVVKDTKNGEETHD